ncbi:hypothetical protein U1Q18_031635 [Sarracenia purpurea var. burkii]
MLPMSKLMLPNGLHALDAIATAAYDKLAVTFAIAAIIGDGGIEKSLLKLLVSHVANVKVDVAKWIACS